MSGLVDVVLCVLCMQADIVPAVPRIREYSTLTTSRIACYIMKHNKSRRLQHLAALAATLAVALVALASKSMHCLAILGTSPPTHATLVLSNFDLSVDDAEEGLVTEQFWVTSKGLGCSTLTSTGMDGKTFW